MVLRSFVRHSTILNCFYISTALRNGTQQNALLKAHFTTYYTKVENRMSY